MRAKLNVVLQQLFGALRCAVEWAPMDENPYRAPVESTEPAIAEPQHWPATLRRWALGPRLPIAWVAVVVGLVGLVAVMVMLGHIAVPRP